MRKIETKNGNIYLKRKGFNNYTLYDSDGLILFYNCDKGFVKSRIKNIKKANSVRDWLEQEQFGDVCWGSKQDCLNYAKGCAEVNNYKFNEKWALDNLNRIGDTYILFEYSEAYL